ncbi:MAG: hypothetical protein JWO03_864 [Bacteroidetes bacterium]|nr:hypothetical protein [Bacteroidota bacterium]
MTRIATVLLFIFCMLRAHAGEYSGNKLLEILGEDRNGPACSLVKTDYLLDKSLKNPELGIKLTVAHDSVSVITAITLTGGGHEINDIKYKEFTRALPFNISFDDGEEALIQKLGEAKSNSEDKMKFKKDGITINVYFKNPTKKKIAFIKFTQNIGMVGPYRADGNHEAPVAAAPAAAAKPSTAATAAASRDSKIAAAKAATSSASTKSAPATSKTVSSLPLPATFGKSKTSTDVSNKGKLYKAIISVIESGEEEMFKDIKKTPSTRSNFWNYKYTYSTSVAIPGEKYNMLYSFPFQKSQLDFVSVLEETEGASPTIGAKYIEVETALKHDFPNSEGWSYHYVVNPEDPKGPKDFELKSAKLGSIILDHSINPYGKHVLYLRFLLQYN